MNKKLITIFIILAALGGAVYFIRYAPLKNTNGPGEIACPEEALLCPDGSYVGRSGPACRFSACPNQASFTGILKQNPGGFFLMMGSPVDTAEVAYSMPLIMDEKWRGLSNRKVRVFGTFTEGATFNADRFEELPGETGDPTLGDVGMGQSVFINGVRITLNKIIGDSRCPRDVKCIQAGSVTASVSLKSDTDKETRDMASNAAPIGFDSFKVSIAGVAPLRTAGKEIDPKNYVITFRVKAN